MVSKWPSNVQASACCTLVRQSVREQIEETITKSISAGIQKDSIILTRRTGMCECIAQISYSLESETWFYSSYICFNKYHSLQICQL